MGRVLPARARRLADRPGLARVDLVPGRQAARRRRHHDHRQAALGEPQPAHQLHPEPRRVQAVLNVSLVSRPGRSLELVGGTGQGTSQTDMCGRI